MTDLVALLFSWTARSSGSKMAKPALTPVFLFLGVGINRLVLTASQQSW
jgi:hypothetical protein